MTKNEHEAEAEAEAGAGTETVPARRRQDKLSRRRHDRLLVNSLRNIAIFLFVVNGIFGYWLLVNTNDVHDQQEKLRSGICVQVSNTSSAYKREVKLIRTDERNAKTHYESAQRLRRSISFLQPLFECHPPIKVPPAPPRVPS